MPISFKESLYSKHLGNSIIGLPFLSRTLLFHYERDPSKLYWKNPSTNCAACHRSAAFLCHIKCASWLWLKPLQKALLFGRRVIFCTTATHLYNLMILSLCYETQLLSSRFEHWWSAHCNIVADILTWRRAFKRLWALWLAIIHFSKEWGKQAGWG